MISKKGRVTASLFDSIMKEGSVLHSPFFTLKYKAFLEKMEPKVAFVAPKSMAKTAIKRNALRRKGYKAINLLKIPKSVAIIVFYKKPGIELTYLDISKDIGVLVNKIKVNK